MARAYNIFVVMGLHSPIAAFTVKREMKQYVRTVFMLNPERAPLCIFRLGDNAPLVADKQWMITKATLKKLEEL